MLLEFVKSARTGHSRTGCCFFVTGSCHKPKDRGWIILWLVQIHSEWSGFSSRFIVNHPVCACTGILIRQKKWIEKKNRNIRQHQCQQNDSNISTLHIAALLGAKCCAGLTTLLRHVGCCSVKSENGQLFHSTFVDVAWCWSCLARFVHTSSIFNTQHVKRGWPNTRNMLPPTVMPYVSSTCCHRLAGACKCCANKVAICYAEMFRSFAAGPGN